MKALAPRLVLLDEVLAMLLEEAQTRTAMRLLLFVGVPLMMSVACGPASSTRAIDPAMVVLDDVPVPQGAVLARPSTQEYVVPDRTVDDVKAFFIQRLPEYRWVFDRKSSALDAKPATVVGCRVDGAFVSAVMDSSGAAVQLLLVKSRDQDTINFSASLNTGRLQSNAISKCPA